MDTFTMYSKFNTETLGKRRYLLVICLLYQQFGCHSENQSPVHHITASPSFLALLPGVLMVGGLAVIYNALGPSYEEPQWVTLDEAYKATFGLSTSDPRVDRTTGQISGNVRRIGTMLDATAAFQRLLISKGESQERVQHYVICALEAEGKMLVSLVNRRSGMQPIEVISKHTETPAILQPMEVAWYQPHERDAKGLILDKSVDWAAVDSGILKQDKAVAILMVLAAQSVRTGARQEYWEIEHRWRDGEIRDVMRESAARVDKHVR